MKDIEAEINRLPIVPQAHISAAGNITRRSRHHLPVRANITLKNALQGVHFLISPAYKPGSVVNGHQSAPCVAAELQSKRFVPPLKMCRTSLAWGVASNRVYSGPMLP